MNIPDFELGCPVIEDDVPCGAEGVNAIELVVDGRPCIAYRCRAHTHPLNKVIVGPGPA